MCGCSLFAEYTVQFNCGSGAGDIPAQTVKAGQTAESVQVPEQEGYVFEGWYQDAALTQPWNLETDKVSSNLTLYASWDRDTKDEISNVGNDKDFSTFKTPGSQEAAYDYRTFFRPSVDGIEQPYVGDPMPYYEDGIYYIYYLKDGGDSYNHSIYLTTTTDFLTYTEYDDPILEASRSGGQDGHHDSPACGRGSCLRHQVCRRKPEQEQPLARQARVPKRRHRGHLLGYHK